jgi:hypothetical protein
MHVDMHRRILFTLGVLCIVSTFRATAIAGYEKHSGSLTAKTHEMGR